MVWDQEFFSNSESSVEGFRGLHRDSASFAGARVDGFLKVLPCSQCWDGTM